MKNKFYMIVLLALMPCMMFAQNYTFTAVANCPEPITNPAVLTFGDTIYVVSGCIGNAAGAPKNLTQHVWQYITATNTWARMADFPGLAVYGTSSFVINGLGYIVNGWDSTETGAGPANLWQYNPVSDTWANKAPFPGPTRYTSASFALNGKGYIGMGFKPLTNDMWEYDPAADAWTQLANFPGVARQAPVWFTIGNYAYVGMGAVDVPGGFYLQSDFYKFDPTTNTWTTLGVFPGNPKAATYSFVVNGQGYVVSGNEQNSLNYLFLGESKSVWQYDPGSDNWTLWGTFPDTALDGGVAASANGAGYMGLGVTNNTTYPIISNFYRFGPGTAPYSCNASITSLSVNNAEYNFEAQGNFSPSAVLWWNFGDGGTGTGTSVFHYYDTAGTYQVLLYVNDTADACNAIDTTYVTVSGISNCSVTLGNTNIGSYYTLVANGAGVAPFTYSWSTPNGYTFSNNPDPLVNVQPGDTANFCVVITDNTGCRASACEQITGAYDTVSLGCQTYLYIYPSTTVLGLYYGYIYHTGATPVTYVWNFGDGTVDSIPYYDSLPNHQYSSYGLYDICLTIIDSAGCSSTYCDSLFYAYKAGGGPMNMFEVVSTPPSYSTGIKNVNGNLLLSAYPNPATDKLAIVVNKQIDYLTVYSALGQVVKQQEAPVNNIIDIAPLASGIYFVDVHIGNSSGRVKFVKTN